MPDIIRTIYPVETPGFEQRIGRVVRRNLYQDSRKERQRPHDSPRERHEDEGQPEDRFDSLMEHAAPETSLEAVPEIGPLEDALRQSPELAFVRVDGNDGPVLELRAGAGRDAVLLIPSENLHELAVDSGVLVRGKY